MKKLTYAAMFMWGMLTAYLILQCSGMPQKANAADHLSDYIREYSDHEDSQVWEYCMQRSKEDAINITNLGYAYQISYLINGVGTVSDGACTRPQRECVLRTNLFF